MATHVHDRLAVMVNGEWWKGTVTSVRPDGVTVLSDAGTHYRYPPGSAVPVPAAIAHTLSALAVARTPREALRITRTLINLRSGT